MVVYKDSQSGEKMTMGMPAVRPKKKISSFSVTFSENK